jgi:hypothetical protein
MGCGDGAGEEETPIEIPEVNIQVYQGDGTPFTGSGDIKIHYYASDQQTLEVDAGTVVNGKLTLALPPTVADEYLRLFTEHFYTSVKITVSPTDLKILKPNFYLVAGGTTYRLSYGKEDGFENDNEERYEWAYITYIYASKEAVVTGTAGGEPETEEDDGITWTGTETGTYNLTLKEGWNAVYEYEYENEKLSGNTGTYTYTYTVTTDGRGIPDGLKWVISPRN